MIEELKHSGFDHKLYNSKLNYPQCPCGNCPRTFFNLLSVAPRMTGKSYGMVQLLKHYEENKLTDINGIIHPMRVILISPTVSANPIYKSLKTLDENDIYELYSEDLLQDILDNIKSEREATDYFKQYKEAFKIIEKTSEGKLHKLYDTHPEVFEILEKEDYKMPNEIEQPKYYEYPVVFIVLDDLMCSSAFNNKQQSKLTNALIKNRHLGVIFCILVQSMKAVTKSMRLNCSVFYLGKFSNKKVVLEDLYEEVGNVLTPDEFIEIYEKATSEQYGSLIIDCSGRSKRFFGGYGNELFISSAGNPPHERQNSHS